MCLPSSDSFYSYDYETQSGSSSSDAADDDDDRIAFDHNLYGYRDYSDDDDRSSSYSFDDYYNHYSHSD